MPARAPATTPRCCSRTPGFHAAAEEARWRAYPLGLAMVAEVADNVLHSDGRTPIARTGLSSSARWSSRCSTAIRSRPRSAPILGATCAPSSTRRLKLIRLHPPKRAMDIPETYVKLYFDAMPIHEKLKKSDFHTTHNYLKVVLCNVHEELTKRIDLRGVRGAATSRQSGEEASVASS